MVLSDIRSSSNFKEGSVELIDYFSKNFGRYVLVLMYLERVLFAVMISRLIVL